MQAHPGVCFVSEPSGERRAALMRGPQIWTVAESWLQHRASEPSAAVAADATGLSAIEVETALAYWAAHRQEIEDQLHIEHSAQDAALAAWERRRSLDSL